MNSELKKIRNKKRKERAKKKKLEKKLEKNSIKLLELKTKEDIIEEIIDKNDEKELLRQKLRQRLKDKKTCRNALVSKNFIKENPDIVNQMPQNLKKSKLVKQVQKNGVNDILSRIEDVELRNKIKDAINRKDMNVLNDLIVNMSSEVKNEEEEEEDIFKDIDDDEIRSVDDDKNIKFNEKEEITFQFPSRK